MISMDVFLGQVRFAGCVMWKTKEETILTLFFFGYVWVHHIDRLALSVFISRAKAEAVSKQQTPLSAGAVHESLRLLSRVSALVPPWGELG